MLKPTDNIIQYEDEYIEPQPGPQTQYFETTADICIYGGAAGGGKTFALLLDALWNHDIKGCRCCIFRKNATQIRNPGGLWHASQELYLDYDGHPREHLLEWVFPSGCTVKFAHLDNEKDKYSYQGAEITMMGFDELTHFSRSQFTYMFSRSRSTCGIKPYIRATCNPDADSWVRDLIDWWIDPDSGLAIPERSGVMRYFTVLNDEFIWADSAEEMKEKYPEAIPKTFTFISASIFDNKILLKADPTYIGSLHALSTLDKERLLYGNWNVKPAGGMYFNQHYFQLIDALPVGTKKIRYWDRASTQKTETNDPDATVGIRLEKDKDGIYYVTDMRRVFESPLGVEKLIKHTATIDSKDTIIYLEQDPGQAGVMEVEYLIRQLQGYNVRSNRVTSDKITRAGPVSSQAEAGNIKVLRANWNEAFFRELENFPEGKHDDVVDSLSGAFNMFNETKYSLANLAKW